MARPHAMTAEGAANTGQTEYGVTAHGARAQGVSNPALIWIVDNVAPISAEEVAAAERAIDARSFDADTRQLMRAMILGDEAPVSQQIEAAA